MFASTPYSCTACQRTCALLSLSGVWALKTRPTADLTYTIPAVIAVAASELLPLGTSTPTQCSEAILLFLPSAAFCAHAFCPAWIICSGIPYIRLWLLVYFLLMDPFFPSQYFPHYCPFFLPSTYNWHGVGIASSTENHCQGPLHFCWLVILPSMISPFLLLLSPWSQQPFAR